jgi:hypothetical protein
MRFRPNHVLKNCRFLQRTGSSVPVIVITATVPCLLVSDPSESLSICPGSPLTRRVDSVALLIETQNASGLVHGGLCLLAKQCGTILLRKTRNISTIHTFCNEF